MLFNTIQINMRNDMRKKDFEYKVALSFAGEQRDYVEKVSKELTRLNVKHFYDYKEQVDLWGKILYNIWIASTSRKPCILFHLFQQNTLKKYGQDWKSVQL